jgi:hypothetical protein
MVISLIINNFLGSFDPFFHFPRGRPVKPRFRAQRRVPEGVFGLLAESRRPLMGPPPMGWKVDRGAWLQYSYGADPAVIQALVRPGRTKLTRIVKLHH